MKQEAEEFILKEYKNENLPSDLREIFEEEREQENERRLSIIRSLNSIDVHVCSEDDFKENNNTVDLISVDSPNFRVRQVPHGANYENMIKDIAELYGRQPTQIRIWPMMLRRNNSFRPFPLKWSRKAQLLDIADMDFNCWKVFVEIADEGRALMPLKTGQICLFIKYFDIGKFKPVIIKKDKQKLHYHFVQPVIFDLCSLRMKSKQPASLKILSIC